ncbi:MAG TPA: ribosome recycling factor [Dehalococcoidia bacterium]|nr:ribosome recycling factor [Dehalococcoidia bacterium]
MIDEVLAEAEAKMQTSSDALLRELSAIRTSRAAPALIEHVKVDYAGVETPLKHIAGISSSGASMLIVQPWDPTSTRSIEKAILKSNLGLTPNINGNIIRLNVPPLSEERRHELIKLVRTRTEEGKVSIRNLRRDAADDIKRLEKDKEISQDEQKRAMDMLQKLTDSFIDTAEQARHSKEKELLEV